MKKSLIKILCCFVPLKSWRIKIRDKSVVKLDYALINGFKFDVNSHNFWSLFNNNLWEQDTIAFYKKYTRPDKNIIDCGVWFGPTVLIAHSFNAKKIYGVEADPSTYYQANKMINKNNISEKVELTNICLYDKSNEIVSFGTGKGNNSDNSIKGSFFKVNTSTLLDYIKDNNIENYNILKIDIEGAETLIVNDLKSLSNKKDLHILLSLHPKFWADSEIAIKKLLDCAKCFNICDSWDKKMSLSECEDFIRLALKKNEFPEIILHTK
ncbi:MAG: FkbM family methyltransferase [Alphaproteobacteria bacterium]